MAAQFQGIAGTGNNGGFAQSLTINVSGILENEELVAAIILQASQTVSSPPSGWTLVEETASGSTNSDLRLVTYRKRAGDSEPSSYEWTLSGFAAAAGSIIRLSGTHVTAPVSATAEADDTGVSSLDVGPVSTSADDGMFIVIGGQRSTSPVTPTVSGYTQRAQATINVLRSTTFSLDQASAGSSGTVTVDWSSSRDGAVAQILAVEPEAAAASVEISAGGASGANLDVTAVVPAQVAIIAGGAGGALAAPWTRVQVAVSAGGAAGALVAAFTGTAQVTISAGGAGGAALALDVPALVAIRAGSAGGAAALVSTRIAIRIRAGGAGGGRDAYIGPGTGIVVVGARDPLGHLREGDSQLVILPWAGVGGKGGVMRVLSRTAKDESSRQEFGSVEFEDVPDPAKVRQLGRGSTPKHVPPERGSVAGQVRKHDREIERIRRRDRRR